MVHPCCNLIPTTQAAKYIALCDLIFGLVGVFWFVFILEGYGIIDRDELYDYMYEKDAFLPPTRIRLVNQTKSERLLPTPETFTNGSLNSTSNPPIEGVTNIQYFSVFTVSPNGIGIDGELGNICLSGFYTAINVALFVLLLSAINKRCIIKLTIWFWLRVAILLLKLILYTTYIALGLPLWQQSPHTIFMFIHAYGLWIVGTLIKEIRNERRREASGPATIEQLKTKTEKEEEDQQGGCRPNVVNSSK